MGSTSLLPVGLDSPLAQIGLAEAPVAQSAEADGLNPSQCGFDPHREHLGGIRGIPRFRFAKWMCLCASRVARDGAPAHRLRELMPFLAASCLRRLHDRDRLPARFCVRGSQRRRPVCAVRRCGAGSRLGGALHEPRTCEGDGAVTAGPGAVAAALRLDQDDVRHLFGPAGEVPPDRVATSTRCPRAC